MESSPLDFTKLSLPNQQKTEALKAFGYTDILLNAELQARMPALPGVFRAGILG